MQKKLWISIRDKIKGIELRSAVKVHAQDSTSTAYCTELNGFLTRVNEFSVLHAKSCPFDSLKNASFWIIYTVTSNVVFFLC